jgi:hypothetical protein
MTSREYKSGNKVAAFSYPPVLFSFVRRLFTAAEQAGVRRNAYAGTHNENVEPMDINSGY